METGQIGSRNASKRPLFLGCLLMFILLYASLAVFREPWDGRCVIYSTWRSPLNSAPKMGRCA